MELKFIRNSHAITLHFSPKRKQIRMPCGMLVRRAQANWFLENYTNVCADDTVYQYKFTKKDKEIIRVLLLLE